MLRFQSVGRFPNIEYNNTVGIFDKHLTSFRSDKSLILITVFVKSLDLVKQRDEKTKKSERKNPNITTYIKTKSEHNNSRATKRSLKQKDSLYT
jgi:hypothetical protein